MEISYGEGDTLSMSTFLMFDDVLRMLDGTTGPQTFPSCVTSRSHHPHARHLGSAGSVSCNDASCASGGAATSTGPSLPDRRPNPNPNPIPNPAVNKGPSLSVCPSLCWYYPFECDATLEALEDLHSRLGTPPQDQPKAAILGLAEAQSALRDLGARAGLLSPSPHASHNHAHAHGNPI